MALPLLATLPEFQEWLGQDVGLGDRAEAVLRGAAALVRRETRRAWVTNDDGDLDDSTPTIDADDLEVARIVVLQIAERKYRNPDGAIQRTTGPFSDRYADEAGLGLYLTESERAMLASYRTNASPSLWTLATTRLSDAADTEYLRTVNAEGDELAQIPFDVSEPT